MPKLKSHEVPRLLNHKRSGIGYVIMDGRQISMGHPFGTPECEQVYQRKVAEWLNNGRRLPNDPRAGMTVAQVIVAFWRHAETFYVQPTVGDDGRALVDADGRTIMEPAGELQNYRFALRRLRLAYGSLPAADFKPKCLETLLARSVKPWPVKDERVLKPWCRTNANRQMKRIQNVFKWAAKEELVSPSVYHGLLTVDALRAGRSDAPESPKVRPVAESDVLAVLPFLNSRLQAMVKLQWITGMRSGEVVRMRTCDIDRRGPVWTYRPTVHKTAHHGHTREIRLGPKAQQILTPWLRPEIASFIFSPAEAEAQRNADRRANRETPMTPSQTKRAAIADAKLLERARPPKRRYTVKAYRRAIVRACDQAFPAAAPLVQETFIGKNGKPRLESKRTFLARLTAEQKTELRRWQENHRWHPHQLRHSAATRFRKEFGLEAARVILGHHSLKMTEQYAEQDVAKATEVMAQIG